MKHAIEVKAESLGFDLFGVTDCRPPETLQYYNEWLSQGHHGNLSYLERHAPLKADPTTLLPEAQSIILVGCNYYHPNELPAEFQIARYAWGDDYHQVMKKMLEQLAEWISQELSPHHYRVFVDSGPLLERDLAQRAGLGWMGKNTCLIHPQKGSWFLLGCLLSSLPLAPDPAFESFHCGTCTRCLDACPTNALIAPHQLDATRCISYWNIEQRESIAQEIRPALDNWAFGCDICQEVCPWNIRFATPTNLKAFYPRAWIQERTLEELLQLSARDFELQIAPRSAVKRPKYRGFLRNLIVVAGNSGRQELRPVLQNLRQQHGQDEMLAAHLDWALESLVSKQDLNG